MCVITSSWTKVGRCYTVAARARSSLSLKTRSIKGDLQRIYQENSSEWWRWIKWKARCIFTFNIQKIVFFNFSSKPFDDHDVRKSSFRVTSRLLWDDDFEATSFFHVACRALTYLFRSRECRNIRGSQILSTLCNAGSVKALKIQMHGKFERNTYFFPMTAISGPKLKIRMLMQF